MGRIGYAIAAAIGSILTLASFMKVQKFAFLGVLKDKYKNIKEVPFAMKLSMIALAAICVIGGAMLLPKFKFILSDATNVLLNGTDYAKVVFGAVLE